MPDTCATVCRIWHLRACNSVNTEKWKPKTDPSYITVPKLAWQESLHVHVHNADNFHINSQFHTKKVTLQLIRTIHSVQYGKYDLLDCGDYEPFAVLHSSKCLVYRPSFASTFLFSLCFCNACADCPISPEKIRTKLWAARNHICFPHFLLRHICSSTHSYTSTDHLYRSPGCSSGFSGVEAWRYFTRTKKVNWSRPFASYHDVIESNLEGNFTWESAKL